MSNHPQQNRPIDQLDVSPVRKLRRIRSEAPGRHNKPARSTTRCHHAVQVAHDIDADLERLLLRALYEKGLVALAQGKIDTAVWPRAALLHYLVTLEPKRLADKQFKFAP